MIKNDKQYQVTKSRLKDFKTELTLLIKQDFDPLLKELHIGAVESQIADFENEILEYERLKEGSINSISINNLSDLYKVLIKARIAHNWTQADLAKKLELKEQQIQRYESTNYSTASLDKLIEIAEVLDIRIDKFKVNVGEPLLDLPKGIVNERMLKFRFEKMLLKAS
jgi:transcriptional regulator with XRE-family HTH domain